MLFRSGVLFDTHHPWRFAGERLPDTVQRLRPWIRSTHWKDSILRPHPKTSDAGDSAAHAAADRARVATVLEWLDGALTSHVWSTEAAGGLLGEVRRDQPRLEHAVTRLEEEHRDLAARVEALRDLLRQGASIEVIAWQARAAQEAFERHGDRSTRLTLDAWNRDLGGDD